MTKTRQLIFSMVCICMACFSCSRAKFDVRSDKTSSLIRKGIDTIQFAHFFPDKDVRKDLHNDFTRFYKNRGYQLAWLTFDDPEKQVDKLLAALGTAPVHGLETENYNTREIEKRLSHLYNSEQEEERKRKWRKNFKSKAYKEKLREQDTIRFNEIARLDFLLTASYLTYASHLLSGMIDPNEEAAWFTPRRKKDLAQYLDRAIKGNDIKASLEKLAPSHEQYDLLQEYLKYLRQIDKRKIPPIGKTLSPGDKGREVAHAKNRLKLWRGIDPGMEDSLAFGPQMEEAVRQFQKMHDLDTTGRVDMQVLTLLNRPVSHWISKIETNMERLRWVQHDFGHEYILVNIPAYQLKVIKNDKTEMQMKVIVGTSYKKTPVFSDTLEYIVFNPTWTVPNAIAIEEMLPQLKEDDEYLADRNLKLYDGWSTSAKLIDPEDVDWDDVDSTSWHYRIVEAPGPENSLGRIKFMMPNSQAIYLHDTPADHLFNAEERTFSHGCIRVAEPVALAEYLLNWDEDKIQEYIDSEETEEIPLHKKIPVHIVYWSAWIDENGMINFRDDVYHHDSSQRKQIQQKDRML